MSTLRAIASYLWHRDSEHAAALCLVLMNRVSYRDLEDLQYYAEAQLRMIEGGAQ